MTLPQKIARWLAPAAAVAIAAGSVLALSSPASASTELCGNTDHTPAGAQFVIQNNKWNDQGVTQCISAGTNSFEITSGNQNLGNGAPASYPSIFVGCHYTVCSDPSSSQLPKQLSSVGDPTSSAVYHTTDGSWDSSYDIWTDPTSNPSGQNHGSEIMIWGNHAGFPNPAGSKVGTANLAGATWDVWAGQLCGDGCWEVNSYVRQTGTNSLDVHLSEFFNDSISRGYTQSSWYLTSVQFGFEPWVGGPGLGVDSFSYTP